MSKATATAYPATLGSMKKLNELARVRMNEFLRVSEMMLGKKHGLNIHVDGSKIEHEVSYDDYYAQIDLASLVSSSSPLNLHLRLDKLKLKKLKAWGKAFGTSNIAIYDSDEASAYVLMNGCNTERVEKSVARLSAGPFSLDHQACGSKVEVDYKKIKAYAVQGKPMFLHLFQDAGSLQLERIKVTGKNSLILTDANIDNFYGKEADKVLKLNCFPSFKSAGKVGFQLVSIEGDYWLLAEWELNISTKMNALTFNRLH